MILSSFAFSDIVDPDNVADGHGPFGGIIGVTGSNEGLVDSGDPVQSAATHAGIFFTQPANSAVDPSVVIPGLGQGTAQPAATVVSKPSRLMSNPIHAFTNESSLHCVEVFDEECDPLDLTNRSISFLMWDRHQNPTFSADATGTKTGFEVTIDALEQTTLDWEWVARDETSREVLAFGRFKGKALPDSNP